ncbi:thioredoxin domain-containing protein [Sphingomonas sp. RS2018]
MRSTIVFALAPMLIGATTVAQAPDTLYLLVASWCAPCRVELSRLPALRAAAAPIAVRVVPIDATAATTAMLRGIDPATIDRSARTIDALGSQTGGLPFSLMTDRTGQRCATHRAPLDVMAVRAMRERCGQ